MTILNFNQLLALGYDGLWHRAMDSAGRLFYIDQNNAGKDILSIYRDLAYSPEAAKAYPDLADGVVNNPSAIVIAIYHNLFNRDPDTGGAIYWEGRFGSAHSLDDVAKIMLDMVSAASGNDVLTLQHKAEVSEAFAEAQHATGKVPTDDQFHHILDGVDWSNASEAVAMTKIADFFKVEVTVTVDHTVIVKVPEPYPVDVPVPTEPAHHVEYHVDASVPVIYTKDYAGQYLNFGAGNPADHAVVGIDHTSGLVFSLMGNHRTGMAETPTSIGDGVGQFDGNSGVQDPANGFDEQGYRVDRADQSMSFVFGGTVDLTKSAPDVHLLVDLDPGVGTHFYDLHAAYNVMGAGTVVWEDSNGNIVIPDEDGSNPAYSENSINPGFGWWSSQIIGGVGPLGSGDIPAGDYTVKMVEYSQVDHSELMSITGIYHLTEPVHAAVV